MRVTMRGSCMVSYGMPVGIPEVQYDIALPGCPRLQGVFVTPHQVYQEVQLRIAPLLLVNPAGPDVTTYQNLMAAMSDFWPPTQAESYRISAMLHDMWGAARAR